MHLSKLPDEVGAKSPSLYIIGSLHGSTNSLHPFMSLPAKKRKWKIQHGYRQHGSCKSLLNGNTCPHDFSGYLHIFDHARLGNDTVDIARHFPTSAVDRIQNGGHGNRKWK